MRRKQSPNPNHLRERGRKRRSSHLADRAKEGAINLYAFLPVFNWEGQKRIDYGGD